MSFMDVGCTGARASTHCGRIFAATGTVLALGIALGFVPAKQAQANEFGPSGPTSISSAGGGGWTTPQVPPPPPPPPLPANAWFLPGAGAVQATQPAPIQRQAAPLRSGSYSLPAIAAPAPTTPAAPYVRSVAQGAPVLAQPSHQAWQDATGATFADQAPITAPAAHVSPAGGGFAAAAPAAWRAPSRVAQPTALFSGGGPFCGMQRGACGLDCLRGVSRWHVRGVAGFVFYEGDDPADDCGYGGVDIGRTFCGCWSLDAYYRWNSGQFDRADPGSALAEDGGDWHHVGLKVGLETPLGGRNSRFYLWGGLGAGWFWTEGYADDDDGFEGFAEAGLGFLLSSNLRIRVGVNVHGMDTSVGRLNPADDGEDRWLWLIAPVAEVELTF